MGVTDVGRQSGWWGGLDDVWCRFARCSLMLMTTLLSLCFTGLDKAWNLKRHKVEIRINGEAVTFIIRSASVCESVGVCFRITVFKYSQQRADKWTFVHGSGSCTHYLQCVCVQRVQLLSFTSLWLPSVLPDVYLSSCRICEHDYWWHTWLVSSKVLKLLC